MLSIKQKKAIIKFVIKVISYAKKIILSSLTNTMKHTRKKYKTNGKSWYENEQFKKGSSWKSKLQFDIDRNIKQSKDWDDFLDKMTTLGYEIKHGKHIAFKHKDKERFTRSKVIGIDYTEDRLKERIKENILHDALDYRFDKKADKIFANYPFMIRNTTSSTYIKELVPSDIINRASSDWVFNLAIMDQLKEDGKAVVIMTNGSTWNNSDKKIRQFFVENGYIESVISLAPNLIEGASIPVSLFILSHNNKSVRVVDAKNLFKNERRKNHLTQDHINTILNMLQGDGELSTTKTIEELSKNEYVLNASRYFDILPTIENGVEFGSVIKNITRGFQLKAADLDELKSPTPTNYQYLMLSNMNDGVVSLDNDDQYLKEIPEKLEKYCIKNKTLILSKTGMPAFKSAVAQIDDNTKVVANGNLFVIELDENKVNPFYIQAFFASHLGETVLKSIYTGATIPTITLDKLKKMIIPLPSLKEQEVVAQKYAAVNELISLNRKVEQTKNHMKQIFEEKQSY